MYFMPTCRKKLLINIYRIKLNNNKLVYERSTTGLDFLNRLFNANYYFFAN